MTTDATVFVVDDDASVRAALTELAASVDMNIQTFSDAMGFLESYDPAMPGCVLADIRMPGVSGMELQQRLRKRGIGIPIIFITGHGDTKTAVQALKDGAFDFIEKPFRPELLLNALNKALAQDAEVRQTEAHVARIKERLSTLTEREREVLDLVIDGAFNKEIAAELGISQRTVEVHRKQVMKKFQADSVVDLVKMMLTIQD